MEPTCGAVAVLRPGGPVRMPLRECCVAVLLGARSSLSVCHAAAVEPAPHPVPLPPVESASLLPVELASSPEIAPWLEEVVEAWP
ncbi:hypothetical protein [Actinoplanes sp. HUAS TT8]|uniref:hypothetical protein n=1 Tax=Actinoplanes sp. HUAS TT8 TaxID=3447453 RepID=UPI003F523D7F